MLRITFIFLMLTVTGCTTSALPDNCRPVLLSSDTPTIKNKDLEGLEKEKREKVFKAIKYLESWGEHNFLRLATICEENDED